MAQSKIIHQGPLDILVSVPPGSLSQHPRTGPLILGPGLLVLHVNLAALIEQSYLQPDVGNVLLDVLNRLSI